jgi:ribosome-binding factor A
MSVHNAKLERQIQREINDIIFNFIHSDILRQVTITEVKLSQKREYATIYYDSKSSKVPEEFKRKNIAIKTALSKRLNIFKVPELIFEQDSVAQTVEKIDDILAKIKKQEEDNGQKV